MRSEVDSHLQIRLTKLYILLCRMLLTSADRFTVCRLHRTAALLKSFDYFTFYKFKTIDAFVKYVSTMYHTFCQRGQQTANNFSDHKSREKNMCLTTV